MAQIPRVIFDYAFMQQDKVREKLEDNGVEAHTAEALEAVGVQRATVKLLVMTETGCDSVWAYVIESKGTLFETWVAPKVCGDLGRLSESTKDGSS